jgi:Tol biopolymer transport system component
MRSRYSAVTTLLATFAALIVHAECRAQTVIDSVTKITNVEDVYPWWSPDGSQIVFQSNRSGAWVLHRMNADGSDIIPLTTEQNHAVTPSWSPDGNWIAYVTALEGQMEDIYLMRPDGSGKTNLTGTPNINESHPHWAPDSRSIIFNATADVSDDGNEEIYEMNINGSGIIRRTNLDGWDTFASISPDGDKILWRHVLTSDSVGNDLWDSEVYVMNRDGSDIMNLSNSSGFDGYPTWSPDGSKILFVSERSGTEQIYVIDVDGENLERLIESTDIDARPCWSADGARIVFNRERNGSIEILIADLRQP